MATRRVERRARARALQALYAADVRGEPPARVAPRVFDDLGVPPAERAHANAVLAIFEALPHEIDSTLASVTTNWRLERLGAIERSLLRLGAAELVADETPTRVVLQEMVRLAERFGGMQSARFVNGVLDGLARKLGRL
jgi:N utilization substance protein B